MPQGQCTLPADDAGRILDRLAGLEQVIRPADIQQALTATGRVNSRLCTLTHEVMLWVVLAMGLLTDLPIRQVFNHARRLRQGEESPHRSSLCVARRRLGVAPVRHLFTQVVRPLARPEPEEGARAGNLGEGETTHLGDDRAWRDGGDSDAGERTTGHDRPADPRHDRARH